MLLLRCWWLACWRALGDVVSTLMAARWRGGGCCTRPKTWFLRSFAFLKANFLKNSFQEGFSLQPI